MLGPNEPLCNNLSAAVHDMNSIEARVRKIPLAFLAHSTPSGVWIPIPGIKHSIVCHGCLGVQ
jgi:hypothetical protein